MINDYDLKLMIFREEIKEAKNNVKNLELRLINYTEQLTEVSK
jgi:hypothetical protein